MVTAVPLTALDQTLNAFIQILTEEDVSCLYAEHNNYHHSIAKCMIGYCAVQTNVGID